MKIWYILMTFPAPAQTYAANDVRALIRLGNKVSVHALRGPRRDAEQLIDEWGFSDVDVTHATVANLARLGWKPDVTSASSFAEARKHGNTFLTEDWRALVVKVNKLDMELWADKLEKAACKCGIGQSRSQEPESGRRDFHNKGTKTRRQPDRGNRSTSF